jgi:hypothetical protein
LDTLKHRFIDFTNVVFYDGQRANYEFSGPLAYFHHHLSEFDQFAFYDAQAEENEFAWPFVTLTHRFIDHKSRFLRLPGGRVFVLRAIPLLKTSLKRHRPSRFFGTPEFRKFMTIHDRKQRFNFSKIVF